MGRLVTFKIDHWPQGQLLSPTGAAMINSRCRPAALKMITLCTDRVCKHVNQPGGKFTVMRRFWRVLDSIMMEVSNTKKSVSNKIHYLYFKNKVIFSHAAVISF